MNLSEKEMTDFKRLKLEVKARGIVSTCVLKKPFHHAVTYVGNEKILDFIYKNSKIYKSFNLLIIIKDSLYDSRLSSSISFARSFLADS